MDRYEFLRSLEAEVAGGELLFSTSAQVALRLQHDLEDPDCPVDRVTRLIQAEPLLSSRVVALANSVAFNPGAREISDVRGAVARVGFRNFARWPPRWSRDSSAAHARQSMPSSPTGFGNTPPMSPRSPR